MKRSRSEADAPFVTPPTRRAPHLQLEALPDDLVETLASFTVGSLADLRSFGSCSRAFLRASTAVSSDANAPFWEAEFRATAPHLHGFVKASDTSPTTSSSGPCQPRTWRERALDCARQVRDAAATPPPRIRASSSRRLHGSQSMVPRVVDVLLFKDPEYGFLVNVGEVRRSVVIYGLRVPTEPLVASMGGAGAISSSAAALEEFGLPHFAPGAPPPLGPSGEAVLVVHSLDGRPVSSYANFDALVQGIRDAGEVTRWRLLHFTQPKLLRHLPLECSFPRPPIASLAPVAEHALETPFPPPAFPLMPLGHSN